METKSSADPSILPRAALFLRQPLRHSIACLRVWKSICCSISNCSAFFEPPPGDDDPPYGPRSIVPSVRARLDRPVNADHFETSTCCDQTPCSPGCKRCAGKNGLRRFHAEWKRNSRLIENRLRRVPSGHGRGSNSKPSATASAGAEQRQPSHTAFQ